MVHPCWFGPPRKVVDAFKGFGTSPAAILLSVSPQEFVSQWSAVQQSERATAQAHFLSLCELLDEPKPHDVDPKGEWFAFEKGVKKTTGDDGWADVWKRGAFAWEYKGKHKDLDRAFVQLQQYAVALENPPLLVVSDIERIRVHTNWTNTVSVRHDLRLEDLLAPNKRTLLKDVFRGSESLRTGESRAALTAKVAKEFAGLAQDLEADGHPAKAVAHFVNRLVFCMFAEDTGILPPDRFKSLLDSTRRKPDSFADVCSGLFAAMHKGGFFGAEHIDWFNGGLFDDGTALPLSRDQIDRVREAASRDWGAIDPSILGTLFERGLDPEKRNQLGAHYTDPENIIRIVEPVVLRPLEQEWRAAKVRIESYKSQAKKEEVLTRYLERLRGVTVLDPACGSGNFLYMALRGLKDLEYRVLFEAEELGLGRRYPELGPEVLRGIEINPYAAELARVSIWIGELQWQLEHGFNVSRDPILKSLERIENRDALVTPASGSSCSREADWPEAEFIVGNPPFIGDKVLRGRMDEADLDSLRKTYSGRVPASADLVCYWFAKAGEALKAGRTRRVGLVSTNKIRKGKSNDVLRAAISGNPIFEAWDDLPWHDEKGAAVRVSVVCFARTDALKGEGRRFGGEPVVEILPDLTPRTGAGERDLGAAIVLPDRKGQSFNGICLAGDFDLDDAMARCWLLQPNVSGKPNSDVLRPLWAGRDLTDGWRGRWLIDFGPNLSDEGASLYELPFARVEERVKPVRLTNNRKSRAQRWWLEGETRPGMRAALEGKRRFLVTPETARHRWFRWLSAEQMPEHKLIVIASADDYVQGVLSSRLHLIWAERKGNWLGVGNDSVYTAQSTFATFPFPEPTEAQRVEIVAAMREIDVMRERYMKPPDWTREETLAFPATVGGPWHRWIPDADTLKPGSVAEACYVRRVAHPAMAKSVAARTLTKLYNERPAWLRNAHERLDMAVAEAYGLPVDLPDSELLAALLEMNLGQASQ